MKNLSYKILVLLIVSLYGCLKDNPIVEPSNEITNGMELLTYIEKLSGDYVNSWDNPAMVENTEVYANLSNYLLLDVRIPEKYAEGHIKGTINLQANSLLMFMKSNNVSVYPKVIIISETGQSAAYYTTLIRSAGYSNTYSLNFGMAYWHKDFADKWINSIGDFEFVKTFTDEPFKKNIFTNLPALSFSDENKPIKDKVEERIQLLLNEGFPEDLVEAKQKFETSAMVSIENFYDTEGTFLNNPDLYIICFGRQELYLSSKMNEPFPGNGHLIGAVHYNPVFDLRSTNDLQTIPANKKILVYDYTGQLSASVTAYLRLLGYNAKSILFGANHFFYSRLFIRESPFMFEPSKIPNYDYEK